MAHYRKADARTAKELTENMGVALENAEWLEARAPDNKYDPYTSVHKMIGLVAAVAGKGASR
jgi:hypothetical protein